MTSESRKKKGIEPEETPRSSGLVSFGDDVRKLLAPLLGKKGLLHADIIRYWPEILGPELASGITPAALSFSKKTEGAILTVKAFSGAFAVEFSARKEQIRDRLNFYFGYTAVSDIRIVQGGTFTPLPQPPEPDEPQETTEKRTEELNGLLCGVENEALKNSLIRLGALITTAKKD